MLVNANIQESVANMLGAKRVHADWLRSHGGDRLNDWTGFWLKLGMTDQWSKATHHCSGQVGPQRGPAEDQRQNSKHHHPEKQQKEKETSSLQGKQ